MNALGTPWDLMLMKPYRDGGPAINGWDIAGLKVGVDVRGTINQPGDRDDGWTVELALPWKILREAAPDHRGADSPAISGASTSRASSGRWTSSTAATSSARSRAEDPLPEDNWVWSPQGAVDMHMPERWGYVQFSNAPAASGADTFVGDPNERSSGRYAVFTIVNAPSVMRTAVMPRRSRRCMPPTSASMASTSAPPCR